MNEDDLRRVLQSAGADPGPKDSWQTFLQVAHRRRQVQQALVGAVVALTVVVAVGTWALTSGAYSKDDAKPAKEDDRQEERTLEDDVDRLDRRFRKTEEVVDAVLPVRPSRRGDGGRGVAPPSGDGTVVETPPQEDPPGEGGTKPRDRKPKDDLYGEMCWGQIPTIVGTNGRDVLRGTPGADIVVAGGGDDTITGARGDDHICGGAGTDTLSGGGGRDRLLPGAGDDRVSGDSGYDYAVFVESPGRVEADLRTGAATGEGDDALEGVEGLVGSSFDDFLAGDVVGNLLGGGDGNDVLEGNGGGDVFVPGPGDDALTGGVGRDTISFQNGGWSAGSPGVNVDLNTGRVTGEGDDRLLGVESATGTFGDDIFSGNSAFNTFDGYAGDDRATGARSDDYLIGGPGTDTLDGGPDDDVLSGGGGVDTCTNGERTSACEAGTLEALLVMGAGVAAFDRITRARRRRPR